MSKELEYIQRQIDIVKQQVKGSKMKIIVTDTFTKHKYDYYERELQTLESIEQALKRLESIDNANPSEALECVERLDKMEFHRSIETYVSEIDSDISETQYLGNTDEFYTIKQALIKEQEPKQYLKWEDLEFKEKQQVMDVLLNGKPYILYFYKLSTQNEVTIFSIDMHIVTLSSNYTEDVQFFNDLHLERVE